jgi:N-methylhydantoinase A
MYSVINTNMANAVREVSVKQGHDPRDFPLIVAGGAGPNHSCMIALQLEIPVMIVPRESSIFCAAGMLMSDLKHDFVRTYVTLLKDIQPKRFKSLFADMKKEGLALLEAEGIVEKEARFIYSLDLRYVNQYHEVNVEVSEEEVEDCAFDSMAAKFHPKHNRLFGYSLEEEGTPVQLINARLICIGETKKPVLKEERYAGEDPADAFKRKRPVYLPNEKRFADVGVFDGAKLRYGNRLKGPTIIEQVNTTTFVTPEYHVLVDRFGSFTLYLPEKEKEVTERIIQ